MSSLKQIRKSVGLTQRQLVEKAYVILGKSVSPIYAQRLSSLWEAGLAVPSNEVKSAIAKVLGIEETALGLVSPKPNSDIPHFLQFLMEHGFEPADVELIKENKILHAILLKTIIKSVSAACEKFRNAAEGKS